MIFDIVEYIILESTIPYENRISRICRRMLILKKRRRVMMSSLPQSNIGQRCIDGFKKLNRTDFSKVCSFFLSIVVNYQ